MKINTGIIKNLQPCKERFENYLNYYKDFDGILEDFLSLDKISYCDKIWVFKRLATRQQLINWATLCANSVLHIFEQKYPLDMRPRLATEVAAAAAADAADAAAAATYAAAAYAAYAAYTAATDAAAATYAAAAYAAYAAYAAADAAADAAAYAATYADAAAAAAAADAAAYAAAKQNQQKLNLLFMVEAIK